MPYKEKIKRMNLTRSGKCLVDIGEGNVGKWNDLKRKLNYTTDSEFVEHLLSLAENQTSTAPSKSLEPKRDRTDDSGADVQTTLTEIHTEDPQIEVICQQEESTGSKKTPEDNIREEMQETDKVVLPDISGDGVRRIRRKKFRSGKKRKLLEDLSQNRDSQTEESSSMEAKEEPSKFDERSEKSVPSGSTTCHYCDNVHPSDACPLLVPVSIIEDSRIPLSTAKAERAKASLPGILQLKEKNGKDGLGVYAKVNISRCTQFGPLVGVSIKEMEIADDSSMKHIWEVSEGKYLCTSDPDKSNWIRWLCPAPTRHDRNIVPIEQDGQLYFVTTTCIDPGSELFYWAESVGPWASKKMEKTSCGGCNLQFEHPMYYRTHCAVFHEASLSLTVRKYHCKVCGKSVLGKQNIMKHALLNHDGKGAYQCQFCSKFFLRLNYLEMHRNYGCSANPHRARPLCDYCGRKFCQPQKLKVHIKRMHSDLAEVLHEFQCRDCLKILGSTAALQRHTKEVHKRPSSVSCSKCGKTFQNKSNLKIHMLTHSGVKPFQCQEDKCTAAFTTKQCLQFHYKKVHRLTEDRFPSIVRSVEYTFESYAGVKDAGTDETEASDAQILENDAPMHLEPGTTKEQNCRDEGEYRETAVDRSRSPIVEPTCEETSVIEYHSSSVLASSHSLRRTLLEYPIHPSRDTTPGVIMSGQSNASLLVEAALESVEDLRHPLPAPSPPPVTSPLRASSPIEPIDVVLPPAEDLRRLTSTPTPHYASVMYDPIRPCTPPMCSPQPVTYLSPRYERHYLTPPPPPTHEFIHDDHRYHEEEMAQNLTKYKYEEARAMYHELIPRYPLTHADYYPWEVLRPAINLPTTVDLSVSAGHLPPPMERPLSPPYQPFHVPQKSPVYHHYTTYY